MAKTYDFIVNTERVNSYGYRVLTNGIDTEQYMRNPVVLYGHHRGGKGDEVIGRTINLREEKGQLIATVEFDEQDEFAQKIAGKVERGFIRMASLYADVIATSGETEHILQGQQFETVTKCKMVELSIVDIGGNDDALRLKYNGQPIILKKIKQITNKKSMDLTTIMLALGIKTDADENAVLQEVQALKLAKETAEKKVVALETQVQEIQTAEATTLIERAIVLELIPEAIKQMTLNAFAENHTEQKAILEKLIADKEATLSKDGKQAVVREVLLGKGRQYTEVEQTFDYLQKHNVVELRRIAKEEPSRYVELVKEYKAGKRFVEKK